MLKWLPISSRRRLPHLILAALALCSAFAGRAQVSIPSFPADRPWVPPPPHNPPKFQDQYPEAPSLTPALTIPLAPLHFSAPGIAYVLRRQSLVSLDFLDENRLLLTFQAPSGLMNRDAGDNPAGAPESTAPPQDSTVSPGGGPVFRDRHIRAVVVALPDGHVESETEWVVPDRSRYLWMLKDGHFLLRDSAGLEEGSLDKSDSSLKTAPSLRLPGRLLWLTMDPALRIMITNSLEPAGAAQKSSDAATPAQAAPAPAAKQDSAAQPTLVARIFERQSGQLVKTTRVPWTNQTRDWPINSEGFLESSHDKNGRWVLTLNEFAGETSVLTSVESTCSPTSGYISESEVLITSCEPVTGGDMLAVTTNSARLWERQTSSNEMWPILVPSPDGSRLARETLILKRSANRYKRLVGPPDIEGQMVRVYDATDGALKLEAPVKPMLDGGGNVAFSPSSRRVAIINSGAIQIFDLPAPARIPASGPTLERKY